MTSNFCLECRGYVGERCEHSEAPIVHASQKLKFSRGDRVLWNGGVYTVRRFCPGDRNYELWTGDVDVIGDPWGDWFVHENCLEPVGVTE